MSDYQTLRDIAAKRKWVFKPDDNYPVEAKAGISGLVHFPNGFLRQAGKKGNWWVGCTTSGFPCWICVPWKKSKY